MRYKLIGKTKFLLPVLVGNLDGTASEHRFIKGKTMVVEEKQINSHVAKFIACKQLVCEECPEEPKKVVVKKVVLDEPVAPPEEKASVGVSDSEIDLEDDNKTSEPAPRRKKKRGRRAKVVQETEEE